MKYSPLKIFLLASLVAAPFAMNASNARAQASGDTATSPKVVETHTKVMESQTKDETGGGLITFKASLVSPSEKAAKQTATVEVKVAAINLVDPDTTDGKPQPGQAHLHYQLDNGAIIATTATKLSFHALSPGPHRITVTLAGNDHVPIGRENVLTVTIP